MPIEKSVQFEFEDRKYEVRVSQQGGRIVVRPYLDDEPETPWVYAVDPINAFDYEMAMGQPAWEHLIDEAMNDVTSKRLDRIRESCAEEAKLRKKIGERLQGG